MKCVMAVSEIWGIEDNNKKIDRKNVAEHYIISLQLGPWFFFFFFIARYIEYYGGAVLQAKGKKRSFKW